MDAEQRFDELDRVVADGRYLLAGLEPALYQIVGEAVGVALQLGEGDAPRAVGDGDAIGKPRRCTSQEIADRDAADAARTGDAAGGCEGGHAVPLPHSSLRGANGSGLRPAR